VNNVGFFRNLYVGMLKVAIFDCIELLLFS